jgi:hypothetical protein
MMLSKIFQINRLHIMFRFDLAPVTIKNYFLSAFVDVFNKCSRGQWNTSTTISLSFLYMIKTFHQLHASTWLLLIYFIIQECSWKNANDYDKHIFESIDFGKKTIDTDVKPTKEFHWLDCYRFSPLYWYCFQNKFTRI